MSERERMREREREREKRRQKEGHTKAFFIQVSAASTLYLENRRCYTEDILNWR